MFNSRQLLSRSRFIFRLALALIFILPTEAASPVKGAPAQALYQTDSAVNPRTATVQPEALDFTRIVTGASHTCALTAGGGVKCWGANYYGQLGDGTNMWHSTPVDVVGLASGVTSLAADWYHTCAIFAGGGVKCWGYNFNGQLGDGTTQERHSPVDVVGLTSGVIALAAGGGHNCALMAGGGVKCWGRNYSGQLGDGTTEERHTPVNVIGLASGITALTAGDVHTCALVADGGVQCWGNNGFGQLGDGTSEQRLTPVDVVGLVNSVTSVAAGSMHTCARTVNGGVQCWGWNWYGQLGDGTTEEKHTPVDVVGLVGGIMAVIAGGYHTCVVTEEGLASCWGDNLYGQLGDGTFTQRSMPVEVIGLASGVTTLTAGVEHTCALTAGGRARCWGWDWDGQLGDGVITERSTPVEVVGLARGVKALAAGNSRSCALTTGGEVKCWGQNNYGQLGDGSKIDRSIPVSVVGLGNSVTAMTAGGSHSCALAAGGGAKCWGYNNVGQLGDGTTTESSTPVNVVGLESGVTILASGGGHNCALKVGGGVKCWGSNGSGQLGDGTNEHKLTPVDVVDLAGGVTAVSAGFVYTCALMEGGGVKCWGANESGQLGDGTTEPRHTPVDVVSLASGVMAVSTGGFHTCTLMEDGGVQCWGANESGQLGDGTTIDRSTPVNVVGLASGVTAISAGWGYTCALMLGGGVQCWGANESGQLGDGTTEPRHTPVDVVGLASNVSALATGGSNTCALAGGRPKCWGADFYGELGIGTVLRCSTPVEVVETAQYLSLSYPNGQPGSYFTVTGWNFPISSTATISVNNYVFTTTVPVYETGSFIFFLDTSETEAGYYRVTASAGFSAVTSFILVPNMPARPKEGGGLTLVLPAGVGVPAWLIYLPLAYKL